MTDKEKKIKRSSIKVENGGITLSWKLAAMVIGTVIAGGGGLSAFTFASEQYVDEHVQESADKIEKKQQVRDDTLDATLGGHKTQLKEHGRVIGEVKLDVNTIQKVQRQQFARDEARRVTEEILNRNRRENEYDRLVQRNMERLSKGMEPCANVDCTN